MLTNADKFQKVNAIIIDTDNFEDIISNITNNTVIVDYDEFYTNMLLIEENTSVLADTDTILSLLSTYFNTNVTGYQLVSDGDSEPFVHVYYNDNNNGGTNN